MRQYILFPVLLLSGLIINGQQVLKLQPGALLTLEAGAEMTVFGDVALENGSRLSNSGTFTLKQNGSSGTANLFDNTITAYSYGPGSFTFKSTIQHTVYSNNIFGRIDVDAGGLLLGSNITASKWRLAKGNITTGHYTAAVLGMAASDLEAGSSNTNFLNSHIDGILRRYINASASASYVFPLGTANRQNTAELTGSNTFPLNGVQYIDAYFAAKSDNDAGLTVSEGGSQYIAVNSGGVWHFVPDKTPSSGKFHLKLFFDGFTGLSDNSFAILQRPDLSSNAADWTVPGGSSINPVNGSGRMLADKYALRNNIAVLGQFGIGQLSGTLPVVLSGFDARRISAKSIQLNWQTQTEFNSKSFGIERRLDNENSFTTTGSVRSRAPGGNSSTGLLYDFTDNNSYTGVSYYRLKQTDIDEKSFYSFIKAVKGSGNNGVTVMLWPNPAKGQFSIKVAGNTGNKDIFINDLQGRVIKSMKISGSQQLDVYGLAAGTYIVYIPKAFGGDGEFKEKVIVIK